MAVSGLIGSLSLPLALPLATASAAYLNGRFGIASDLAALVGIFGGAFDGTRREKRDRMNLFYDLEELAKRKNDGDRLFLIYNGKRWTYKEAYVCVLRYSRWLKEDLGVQRDDIVAMDFMNSDTLIWLVFALWNLSAKPAMINYNLTGTPLLHCIRASTAHMILVDHHVAEMFTEEVQEQLSSSSFRSGGGAVQVLVVDPTSEFQILASTSGWREPDQVRSGATGPDMAMLIYTSGTTGLPKPAVVSWSKAALGSRFTSKVLSIKKNDIIFTCMPLYHSSAMVLALLTTLRGGAAIALGKKFSARTFWSDVQESKATAVQYVGETLRYLLATPRSSTEKQHSVRLVYGNGMRPDVWPVVQERFAVPTVAEFYAATEGPGLMWNISSNTFSQGAIGHSGSLPNLVVGGRSVVVKFNHETNEAVRDHSTGFCIKADCNEPGELLYKLDEKDIKLNYQGYFGNSEATSKKIIRNVLTKDDAYLSTGDLIRRDKENRTWFVDRIGDTFRWRSENVSTAEVSEVIGTTPGVAEANVYGVLVPKHDGRAGCAAIILSSQDSSSTLSTASSSLSPVAEPPESILTAIAAKAQSNLPKYAVPLFLRFTRQMDMTGTNKQQKHALREQGIKVEEIDRRGDRMYWLHNGRYVPFRESDLKKIEGGTARL